MRAMALHRRMAESTHLPECFAATNKPWACPVCDALRACEQRVQRETLNRYPFSVNTVRADGQRDGFAEGVQAARDAVESATVRGQHRAWVFKDDAVAAIDALAEHKSRSGYDPRATDERP